MLLLRSLIATRQRYIGRSKGFGPIAHQVCLESLVKVVYRVEYTPLRRKVFYCESVGVRVSVERTQWLTRNRKDATCKTEVEAKTANRNECLLLELLHVEKNVLRLDNLNPRALISTDSIDLLLSSFLPPRIPFSAQRLLFLYLSSSLCKFQSHIALCNTNSTVYTLDACRCVGFAFIVHQHPIDGLPYSRPKILSTHPS